ncbi:aspartate aminotransferase family protein [Actinomadura flavalba]|uniref:aspartate aminotransferase family protein n=1 Tax=Actinomadura flavalba TaxID=1120938 RepID=UPI00036FE38F|nr:aspartate aminotransferase family protein [Actinomadura flavalba]
MSEADRVARGIADRYAGRSPASRAAFADASRVLPGGDTRTMVTYSPYPLYFDRGEGARVRDVDGNWYLDVLSNYGALVHGHNHPALVAAVRDQVGRGTAPGGPSTLQIRHAERLCARMPALERVRYCNSGTEATMWAIRTARAFTGRDVIIKIDGGYHGTHDWGHVSAFITAGPGFAQSVPGLPEARLAHGVPRAVLTCVVAVPFNDLAAARRALRWHRGRVAAVLVEPMLGVGGGVPADPAYLHGLREVTRHEGVLLVLDECATFRVGPWQVREGLRPDLTTLSKIIGGGLPIGVFGGRADVMAVFDPAGGDPVYHASAFGANNLSLAAGNAALDHFGSDDIDRLNAMGERLRARLDDVAAERGVLGHAVGAGSLSYFHFGAGVPRNAADSAARREGRDRLRALLHLHLLNQGFLTARHGLLCLSLPMDDGDVDAFVAAYADALEALLPYLSHYHPDLLASSAAGGGD